MSFGSLWAAASSLRLRQFEPKGLGQLARGRLPPADAWPTWANEGPFESHAPALACKSVSDRLLSISDRLLTARIVCVRACACVCVRVCAQGLLAMAPLFLPGPALRPVRLRWH